MKRNREELAALAGAAARAARARLGRKRKASGEASSIAAPAAPAAVESDGAAHLAAASAAAAGCTRCRLSEGRTKVVYGVGAASARLMVVGEGPGEEEDRQGLPFVGRAGQLLTKMLAAIGLAREEVYITNVVKCRPPGNRNPADDEIAACEPYLLDQVRTIRPAILLLLGNHAVRTLLGVEEGITRVRGRLFRYEGILCVPSYHPAYLLRSPNKKVEAWEDLKVVRQALDGRLDVAGAVAARPRTRAPVKAETRPSLL